MDATAIAENIKKGEFSALEVLEEAINKAEAVNPSLNFLSEKMYERARNKAQQAATDAPFFGVPYLIKDMFDIQGTVTSFGSRVGLIAPPAPKTFTSVVALEKAGLNLFGKTTLGEFGFLPTTESIRYGITRNPWNPDYTAGGSSGGTSAAVAAGVVPMSDAADGGGSIRIPSSICGLVGLKPSRDRIIGDYPNTTGINLIAQHCLSRTVRDSANLLAAVERTGDDKVYDPVGKVTTPLNQKLKVGFHLNGLHHQASDNVQKVVVNALKTLEDLGHSIEETDWTFNTSEFIQAFGAIWAQGAMNAVDAITQVTTTLNKPIDDFLEPYTIAMADLAREVPPEHFLKALETLKKVSFDYYKWFDNYDVIVSPVLLTKPVEVGKIDGTISIQTLTERVQKFADFTMVENATGVPSISLPLGWSDDGLPIGVQISAPLANEQVLLELAFLFEEAMPWRDKKPKIWAPNLIN